MATHATNRFAGPRTGPVEFNFTGGYLDKSHVKCFIENDTTNVRVDVPITASNFLNDYTLDGLPAVEAGHTLVVYRETPANYLVDFSNTSRITEHSLDVSARQGLFKAVEALDATQDGHNPELSSSVAWGNVIGKPFATDDVPGIVKVGLGLDMGPDGRLNVTGVNAPTGPAGGVLSGTYPNPGFAQDMATQAELNAGLGGKANVTHTHSLSALTQSGAGVGQVPMWNGAAWEPGTVSGGGGGGGGSLPVVVYIGDSLGSDHPNLAASPAVQLERTLNAGGYACRVVNLSVNGHSFYRANTSAVFGTQTVVQRAIALNPAAILVALGFNDTVMAVDGRTIAQVQADATTFFSTLRAALPSTAIVAATELAYDKVNFTPATLKNRGVLPLLMTLRTTGILTGCWSSEILEDSVASATSTRFTNFDSLDATIRGLTTVSHVITMDLWKIARLGLCSYDGLHLTAMGSSLVATTWRNAFKVVPALSALAPNLRALTYGPFDGFMNPDGTIETGGIWDLLMQADASDWAIREFSVTGQHTNHQGGPWMHCNPSAWFLPSKGAYRANALEYTTGSVFTWELRGVAPSTAVESSIDGGAFTTIGTTSHKGDYLGSGVLPITPGTYAVRYKVANEVHGPVNLVVTAGGSAAASWQPKVISGANLTSTNQTIATTNSRTYIDFSGTNYVSSHPDLTLIKSGTETRIRVNVNPGKSVWVRMSVTLLVTASAGNNILWMLGAEATNDSLGFLYNVQLDAKYSPVTNYALVLTGSFVGKLTATTIFIPWVLRAGTGGTISSSATNGTSSFWSLEIINET